jgi:hypothetical protein
MYGSAAPLRRANFPQNEVRINPKPAPHSPEAGPAGRAPAALLAPPGEGCQRVRGAALAASLAVLLGGCARIRPTS